MGIAGILLFHFIILNNFSEIVNMKRHLLGTLEKAINYYLHLDEEIASLLFPLQQKVLVIEIQGVGFQIQVKGHEDKLEFLETEDGIADCYMSGTPIALFLLSKSDNPAQFLASNDIEIRGNLEVAQHFANLFKQIDIDWEEYLSRWVGDSIAHTAGSFMNNIVSWGRQSIDTIKKNVTEYLQEEIRAFPTRDEAMDFLDEVDKLRLDVDRLQARLERLKNSLVKIRP